VAAILVGVLKCRTQIWKRTTQESFQQSFMQIKKRGNEIKKKSSPLKLQSQSQPNFAEMVFISAILVEIGSVVSEEKI
jgi:hypothetical protein